MATSHSSTSITVLDVRGTFAYTLLQEQGLSDQQIAVELGVEFIPQEEEAHAELLRDWENPKQVVMQTLMMAGQEAQATKMAEAIKQVRLVVRKSDDLDITTDDLDALFATLI